MGEGRWVAVDVETTGLVPGVHAVWEVALVTDDGQQFSWLIEDVKVASGDAKALELSRFYERWDCATARDGKLAAVTVARLVAKLTAGRHLVAVNPAFDAEFLDRMLRANNRAPAWHYHLIDVAAMALGWIHGHDDVDRVPTECRPAVGLPWRSDDLSRACGVEPPSEAERHTALGDARWAARWFRTLTGAADG